MDELRQVLDRIDVVVRRRADQADARRRVAHAGDVLVDLVAGQLAALPGLGALGHLDLDVVGVDQVLGGDAEPARGHLLDRRAHGIAVGQRLEAVALLAALAGVGAAADAVHGDGQRGVGLAADRAEAHGAGGEALDDLGRRLDVLERDRAALARLQPHQAAQRQQALGLLVDGLRRRSCRRPAGCRARRAAGWRPTPASRRGSRRAGARRTGRRRRAWSGRSGCRHRRRGGGARPRRRPPPGRRPRSCEAVPVKYFSISADRQADGVEDLGAAVGLVGGDAHLGHHLQHALADRLDVVLADLVGGLA